MSWSISALGHPKRVKAIIEEQANARWDPKPPDENTQQKRLAAALLLAQIDCLKLPNPTDHNNCVRVDASGHLHDGRGSMRLEVQPVTVHLDEPETPVAVPAASPVLTVPAAAPASAAVIVQDPLGNIYQVTPVPPICPDCGQSDGHSRGCSKF